MTRPAPFSVKHNRIVQSVLDLLATRPAGMTPGEISMHARGRYLKARERTEALDRLVAAGLVEETKVAKTSRFRGGGTFKKELKAYRLRRQRPARVELN